MCLKDCEFGEQGFARDVGFYSDLKKVGSNATTGAIRDIE